MRAEGRKRHFLRFPPDLPRIAAVPTTRTPPTLFSTLDSRRSEALFSAKACRHTCLRGEHATTGPVPVERCSSPATIPAAKLPQRGLSPLGDAPRPTQRYLAGSSAPLGPVGRAQRWAGMGTAYGLARSSATLGQAQRWREFAG